MIARKCYKYHLPKDGLASSLGLYHASICKLYGLIKILQSASLYKISISSLPEVTWFCRYDWTKSMSWIKNFITNLTQRLKIQWVVGVTPELFSFKKTQKTNKPQTNQKHTLSSNLPFMIVVSMGEKHPCNWDENPPLLCST